MDKLQSDLVSALEQYIDNNSEVLWYSACVRDEASEWLDVDLHPVLSGFNWAFNLMGKTCARVAYLEDVAWHKYYKETHPDSEADEPASEPVPPRECPHDIVLDYDRVWSRGSEVLSEIIQEHIKKLTGKSVPVRMLEEEEIEEAMGEHPRYVELDRRIEEMESGEREPVVVKFPDEAPRKPDSVPEVKREIRILTIYLDEKDLSGEELELYLDYIVSDFCQPHLDKATEQLSDQHSTSIELVYERLHTQQKKSLQKLLCVLSAMAES